MERLDLYQKSSYLERALSAPFLPLPRWNRIIKAPYAGSFPLCLLFEPFPAAADRALAEIWMNPAVSAAHHLFIDA